MVADLARRADRHAAALWSKRDRRAYRTGRYFARVRPAPGWRGNVLLKRKHPQPAVDGPIHEFTAAQWHRWLADPTSWLTSGKLLKDSHTATVARAELDTHPPTPVVIKRPLPRTAWKRLVQLLGPSSNQRNWRTANMLRNRDLPAAQPLAVVERFVGPLRVDSIAFTEFIADAVDPETFLTRVVAGLDHAEQYRVKRGLSEAIVALLRAFHERGFIHRDLKAPNLLVAWPEPRTASPTLSFVDMDGIRLCRRPGESQRVRAIVRLCASLLAGPACTRSDRLRFLKRSMTQPGRSDADWKAQWRQLDRLVGSKLRDKESRRQWKLEHYGRE